MSQINGKSIGRYHILEQLGQGGMATVYKAYDTQLERDVALKMIRMDMFPAAAMERVLKRFEREAKALARLSHPNIVGVMDYGEYNGAPFLVMKYLPGGTLKELIGTPIPYQEAAGILKQVAEALAYAHSHGILHRDVKPSNILLSDSGEATLTDFGIAKILEANEQGTLTETGLGVGTPEYMAPEQGLGKNVDGRADIYALGVVFYELITGHKPYTADTPMAVIIKQINDPLPRPRDFVAALPDQVEKVLFKALAKNPHDRYQSMGEFAKALQNLAETIFTVQANLESGFESFSGEQEQFPIDEEKTRDNIRTAKEISDQEDKSKSNKYFVWIGVGFILLLLIVFVGTSITNQKKQAQIAEKTLLAKNTQEAKFAYVAQTEDIQNTEAARTDVAQELIIGKTATVSAWTLAPTATSTPILEIGSKRTREMDGMVQVYVPAGEFIMGSEVGSPNESPSHEVYLDAYWIDQTEVTNGMYEQCVASGVCDLLASDSSRTNYYYYGNEEFSDYPVVNITWHQASTYCQWTGGRLPSEAEWEKAARGVDGQTYPWGNGYANYLRLNYNFAMGDTNKVGSYPEGVSPFGALDMAGNVFEWVADWYDSDYYSKSPISNPIGPETGEIRVMKSCSFTSIEEYARSSLRFSGRPLVTIDEIGFRCAGTP